MRNLFNLIIINKVYVFLISLICLLSPLLSVLTAESMGRLTEHFTQIGLYASGKLIYLTLLFFIAECFLEYLYLFFTGKLKAHAYSIMQQTTFDQLTSLPIDHPLMTSTGDLYSRISNDTQEVTLFISETAPAILMQTFQLLITLIYLFFTEWIITTFYFLTVLFSIGLQSMISRIIKKASVDVKKREVELNTRLNDFCHRRIIVKTYEAQDFAIDLCEESSKNLYKANMRLSWITMPLSILGIMCGMFPILSICLSGLYLLPQGFLEIGTFMSIFYLCQKIVPRQLHYVDLILKAIKVKPSFKRLMELWQVKKNTKVKEETNNKKQTNQVGSIILSSVSYRYPGQSTWAVRDLSISISAGQKIAFIGESGCGKSTILKLISALLVPHKGFIQADQALITEQEPYLFADTIRQNICYGKAQPASDELSAVSTEATFDQACREAELLSFIKLLPKGLDTLLSENGENLSGGQRQRIAVARALYSGAPILLFDESLSALDGDTAKKVVKNICQDLKNTTVIMVLHQKELLPFFDKVFIFKQGRLVKHSSGLHASQEVLLCE